MNGTVVFLEPKGTILEVIRSAKKQGFHVVALTSDASLLENASKPYDSAVSMIDQNIKVRSWSAGFSATFPLNR